MRAGSSGCEVAWSGFTLTFHQAEEEERGGSRRKEQFTVQALSACMEQTVGDVHSKECSLHETHLCPLNKSFLLTQKLQHHVNSSVRHSVCDKQQRQRRWMVSVQSRVRNGRK